MPFNGDESLIFLKNQTETLEFKGQGIYTDYYRERSTYECESYHLLQRKFLTFLANNNDSFMIELFVNLQNEGGAQKYYAVANGIGFGPTYSIDISKPWPPVLNAVINGQKYDSVAVLMIDSNNYIISKPFLGVLKIRTKGSDYEIIKP